MIQSGYKSNAGVSAVSAVAGVLDVCLVRPRLSVVLATQPSLCNNSINLLIFNPSTAEDTFFPLYPLTYKTKFITADYLVIALNLDLSRSYIIALFYESLLLLLFYFLYCFP